MTVTWPKSLARALTALVAATFALLLVMAIVAWQLLDALEGQDDARERSECLTEEYKEFFAGTAQALSAVLEDRDPPQDALDRLSRAAEVLPEIDETCAQGDDR